jgi:MoaA/NifB/PqqE/SkfB family radical SAM enzyme
MSKDPTFSGKDPGRSNAYEDYRRAWDMRGVTFEADTHPIHLDIETVATCDLKCGSSLSDPTGFCQIWTHEHVRKLGFGEGAYKRGMMDPRKFYQLADAAKKIGVKSVKLNYRGEPTLHPEIIEFVKYLSDLGFQDIMMNTNGNGGARRDPELFVKLVKAGITSLNFSVDAADASTYHKQRVGGDWTLLLNSVRSAVLAKDMGFGSKDLKVRASAVRTSLNMDAIDSGDLHKFWREQIGVDWVSVSECYFPAGSGHDWVAVTWEPVTAEDYQCADPFRRMVITWDLKHTLPCCQGFTLEWEGGEVFKYSDEHALYNAWNSNRFDLLRDAHKYKYWDKDDRFKMCQNCPLTKKPVRYVV